MAAATTYAEKLALLKRLQEEIHADRTTQLDALIEEFKAALESNGFSLAEGYEAVSGLVPGKAKRAPRRANGTAKTTTRPYTVGVKYRNPDGHDVWEAKGRGALPKWIRERTRGMTPEQATAEFNRLANH